MMQRRYSTKTVHACLSGRVRARPVSYMKSAGLYNRFLDQEHWGRVLPGFWGKRVIKGQGSSRGSAVSPAYSPQAWQTQGGEACFVLKFPDDPTEKERGDLCASWIHF
jgi:hypothetical protein